MRIPNGSLDFCNKALLSGIFANVHRIMLIKHRIHFDFLSIELLNNKIENTYFGLQLMDSWNWLCKTIFDGARVAGDNI